MRPQRGALQHPGFAAPRPLRSVRLGPVGKAHAIMRAASIVGPLAPLPALVHAVGAATPRGDSTESALLAQFAEYERVEADGYRVSHAGSLASLASVMPGGGGDGFR